MSQATVDLLGTCSILFGGIWAGSLGPPLRVGGLEVVRSLLLKVQTANLAVAS